MINTVQVRYDLFGLRFDSNTYLESGFSFINLFKFVVPHKFDQNSVRFLDTGRSLTPDLYQTDFESYPRISMLNYLDKFIFFIHMSSIWCYSVVRNALKKIPGSGL